jgi:hypothetical protein
MMPDAAGPARAVPAARAGIVRAVTNIEAKGRFRRLPSPAGRVLYGADPPATSWIDVSGWVGGDLPAVLEDPRFGAEGAGSGRWRLEQAGGGVDFLAAGVTLFEPRPELLAPLGAPFALKPGERRAARLLLALLRVPGGARLLRAWHARRK